jgi:hypothetical protein
MHRTGSYGPLDSGRIANMSLLMILRTTYARGVFREMAWLNAERARVYAVGMASVWTVILVKLIWSLQDGRDSSGALFGGDYSSFWAASRLVLADLPAYAYVPALHHLAELPVLTRGYEYFFYPPTYLVLCTPLALISFFPSLIAFLCVSGAAFVVTIYRILRTPWALPAILAFPVIALNVIPGQNAFLTAAVLGTGLTILDRRPSLAGAVLGLMVMKPHLAVAVPIALIISQRWTVLMCAGTSALGLLLLSYAIFGWDVWAAFLANAHSSRDTLEQGLVGFNKMQSAFSLVRSLGGGVMQAYIIQGIVAGGSVYALIWARRQRVAAAMERTLTVLACLLITPFLLHYDVLILAVPLAWMLREWADRGFPPWSKLVLILVFIMPIGFWAYGPMPFGLPALLLFGAFLMWSASAPCSRSTLSLHGVRPA